MQTGEWIAVAAVLVAVVALLCVLALAVRLRRTSDEVRRLSQAVHPPEDRNVLQTEGSGAHSAGRNGHDEGQRASGADDAALVEIEPVGPSGEDAVVVTSDGRSIVLPTSAQVVSATMSRPLVRGAVLSHGVLYALRPESRDRIVSLVRRELRSRRKARLRAGRSATRLHRDATASRRHADDDRRGVRP